MQTFVVADGYCLPVSDIATATAWYKEKFGLKQFKIRREDGDERGQVSLAYDEESPGIDLFNGPVGSSGMRPILFTCKVAKAHEFLTQRGVTTGPIQRDAQGTQYFEARDLDGNLLEVSEEP